MRRGGTRRPLRSHSPADRAVTMTCRSLLLLLGVLLAAVAVTGASPASQIYRDAEANTTKKTKPTAGPGEKKTATTGCGDSTKVDSVAEKPAAKPIATITTKRPAAETTVIKPQKQPAKKPAAASVQPIPPKPIEATTEEAAKTTPTTKAPMTSLPTGTEEMQGSLSTSDCAGFPGESPLCGDGGGGGGRQWGIVYFSAPCGAHHESHTFLHA